MLKRNVMFSKLLYNYKAIKKMAQREDKRTLPLQLLIPSPGGRHHFFVPANSNDIVINQDQL